VPFEKICPVESLASNQSSFATQNVENKEADDSYHSKNRTKSILYELNEDEFPNQFRCKIPIITLLVSPQEIGSSLFLDPHFFDVLIDKEARLLIRCCSNPGTNILVMISFKFFNHRSK
jgi:hypothetical protein